MPLRILVPKLVDASNNNPQSLNTKAMLARFSNPQCAWTAPYYDEPNSEVVRSLNVRLVRLWRWRFWQLRMLLLYHHRADAIFYPGFYWFDEWALRLRKITGRKVPVIATLEGLVGDETRRRLYSDCVGHEVYFHSIPSPLLAAIDRGLRDADHIIAISPFLARLGAWLYGDKISVLPLGIDGRIFHANGRERSQRFLVVGTGTVYDRKRPRVFLDLAEKFPNADFVWFGDGGQRANLLREKLERGLRNVEYPGAMPNFKLAHEFRRANLLVLPSYAEGVPKVTQEAAACGLPVVIYGFYEAPTVVDGQNGYVVWSDEELFERVEELIRVPTRAEDMGRRGGEMAKDWSWDVIAPRWEQQILHAVGAS